ncbi:MAG: type IX secretion system protein PorQ [Bacteroidales bacterium]|nr:type IX secretion system protein PorQ [Bacteroidales bacterium]
MDKKNLTTIFRTLQSLIILLIIPSFLQAQTGGESTFSFLELKYSAKTASLAGTNISAFDQDINSIFDNPAILDSNLNRHFALNYTDYISDINYGMISYAHHLKNIGTFAISLNYMNYGSFKESDETGIITGDFNASDYVLSVVYANSLTENIQYGFNLKTIYSEYYIVNSFGLSVDAGIIYHNSNGFNSAIVIRNLGSQIKPYTEGNYEALPFDVQLGFSQKLKHAPFRFLAQIHHLNNWSLQYDSPLIEGNEIDSMKTMRKIGNELLHHINIGAEINPLNNFYLRVSYDFQKMLDLAIDDKKGMVGFSFGVGLKLYKFHISYARSIYHLAGKTNTFSITSNLREFYKKSI